jgi:hypothetical protein
VNQSTATAVDNGGAILLTIPASGGASGDNHRFIVRSVPATPYTVTAFVAFRWSYENFSRGGLYLRNSGSGNLIMHGFDHGASGGTSGMPPFAVMKYTSPTAFSATYTLTTPPTPYGWPFSKGIWLRLADDGTTRTFSTSVDGFVWTTVHSVGHTDFITPDQIGIGLNGYNGTRTNHLSLMSWNVT